MAYGLCRFSEEELGAYLDRIGLRDAPAVSAEALERLHFEHIQNIVFENLDIHLGRLIEIDVARIFDKIVGRGRGGFCYELNTLFASLLHTLGFDVTLHACRVVTSGARWIPFGHIATIVHLEEDWLADVGFGNSFQRPLRLAEGVEQADEGGTHLLETVEEGWFLRSRIDTDTFEPEYRLDLTPQHIDAFKERCHWTQTSVESGFTHRTFVTRPHSGGRLTLLGLEARTFKGGVHEDRKISWHERDAMLAEVFRLPADDIAALPKGERADWFDIPAKEEKESTDE